ncbi:hypothetical protein C0J52_06735 [Blattella germanica]|nr:hypothetical protein C0J52_06735 [Blattella germanica]
MTTPSTSQETSKKSKVALGRPLRGQAHEIIYNVTQHLKEIKKNMDYHTMLLNRLVGLQGYKKVW